jgi:DNA-directed RNA polymerase subunit RPC12/RpoP
MTRCDYCGSTILFGARRDGQRTYCNAACAGKGALVAASREIPEDAVKAEVARVHRGPCPKCGGAGPIDVQTSYRVWSAVYLTNWSSRPQLTCRRCGIKARLGDMVYCLLLGWWGFPWGVVITPVQVLRNVAGLFRSASQSPSPQLAGMVRLHMAAARRVPRAGAA